MIKNSKSGFTVVELLVTLFIAAAFLATGYQLYGAIIKDAGQTRAKARANNVAYDYLKRYESTTTSPCISSQPLIDLPVSVSGISASTITIDISCPYTGAPNVSKVTATLKYNNPQKTTSISNYASADTPALEYGLVGWWPFNGDASDASGKGNSGTIIGATLTTGQNSTANSAYLFNNSAQNQSIDIPSTFGLSNAGLTISLWFNNPTATNLGAFIKVGDTSSYGYGIGIGGTNLGNAGNNLIIIFESVRWIVTSATISTGWHSVVFIIDNSGVPSAYLDGVSAGSYSGTSAIAPTGDLTQIGGYGTTGHFNGSIDDVRIYKRVLSSTEITSLYSLGAN